MGDTHHESLPFGEGPRSGGEVPLLPNAIAMLGVNLPDVSLPATDGSLVNLSRLAGRSIVFFYPYTGRPGHPDPEDWDDILGAHGSTPQALAFSQLHGEFAALEVRIFGVSFQTTAWQKDFVRRNKLRFSFLSDAKRHVSMALQLETFSAGRADFLKRRTMLIQNGIIIRDIYPVAKPAENAADMLKALQA